MCINKCSRAGVGGGGAGAVLAAPRERHELWGRGRAARAHRRAARRRARAARTVSTHARIRMCE